MIEHHDDHSQDDHDQANRDDHYEHDQQETTRRPPGDGETTGIPQRDHS